MKNVTVLCLVLFLQATAWAQLKGNKKIITRTYPIAGATFIDLDLYADVTIDYTGKPELTITADANLLDRINTAVENGQLKLDQKEWIQPSQKMVITIGAPTLMRVQQSTHETTRIRNIDASNFNAMAIVGKLVLEGKVQNLSAGTEIGTVDARDLETAVVDVNIWSRGKVLLDAPQTVTGTVKGNGQVVYNKQPVRMQIKTKDGGNVQSTAEVARKKNPEARFIKFKVRNNSTNRIQCYVVGPKPDGSRFSYGFPMNPGQGREKNWSIGSKVYRVTKLGNRNLLTEIKAADEGQVVKLYRDRAKK